MISLSVTPIATIKPSEPRRNL